jgi:hypothetical protein
MFTEQRPIVTALLSAGFVSGVALVDSGLDEAFALGLGTRQGTNCSFLQAQMDV